MEPISMAAVGTALKAVVNVAKGVDKSELRAELQGAIIDLQERIFELHSDVGALIDENRGLKDEIASLNEAMAISSELTVRENAYFRGSSSGQEEGPFCTRCWDVDSRLVRLHEYGRSGTICPNCDKRGKAPRVMVR